MLDCILNPRPAQTQQSSDYYKINEEAKIQAKFDTTAKQEKQNLKEISEKLANQTPHAEEIKQ